MKEISNEEEERKDEIKYTACKSCIGKNIEGIRILTPCLRCIDDGYDCPKEKRGVDGNFEPEWEEISEEEFFKFFFSVGELLNARTKFLYEEDVKKVKEGVKS